MAKHLIILLGMLSWWMPALRAQSITDERVLFTVAGKPVTVGEFVYIYGKTNAEKADYSRESLQEYLDLYTKFKLKVARAFDMRLDTIETLREELAGYRRQLSDSYLIDRAITDKLVQTAHERMQQDVDISHVLFTLSPQATPADTLAALQRAQDVLKRLRGGADFATVAREASDDTFSKDRGGRIGFVSAMLPNGLHRLEQAAYEGPLNQVQGPIRTAAGYHLLLVHERRPARGEVEVSHILVRKDDKDAAAAQEKIDGIYKMLQAGRGFDEVATEYSEDDRTARNKGYIGFFGINRYERPFEDAAFSLQKDGDYTRPFESSVGFHIIRRISARPVQPLAAERPRLEARIKADQRFAEAREQLMQDIRRKVSLREHTAALDRFAASQTDTFTTFRWKAPAPSSEKLLTMGKDHVVTMGDFTDYLAQGSRQRAMAAREGSPEAAARALYREFVNDQLLKYEEAQLEKNYPEFRALMREYEEGILLFEATKVEVWDRAAQDSAGLAKFFATIPGKYRWAPRARTAIFSIGASHREQAPAIREFAQTHNPAEVESKFNTAEHVVVTVDEDVFEKNRLPELTAVPFQKGSVTDIKEDPRGSSLVFMKIEEVLPEGEKTLAEARGYVIADYQDKLEQDWVESLRKQYKVDVNRKVFESLVKE